MIYLISNLLNKISKSGLNKRYPLGTIQVLVIKEVGSDNGKNGKKLTKNIRPTDILQIYTSI